MPNLRELLISQLAAVAVILGSMNLAGCQTAFQGGVTSKVAPPALENPESPRDQAVRQSLETDIPELTADQAPLEKVLSFLEERSKVHFFVDWPALERADVKPDMPVDVSFKGVSIRKALTTVLGTVGGESLGYAVLDGGVTISTTDELNINPFRALRIYDLAPMLARDKEPAAREVHAKAIVELIVCNIATDSWKQTGGTIGAIQEIDGKLVVDQTMENQVAIYNLLMQIYGVQPLANPDPPRSQEVRRRLETKVKHLDLNSANLETALLGISQDAGINIEVDWPALHARGVERNTPVSTELWDTPYRTAIQIILKRVGNNIVAVVDDGVLMISSRENLLDPRYTCVRVFDLGSLRTANSTSEAQESYVRGLIPFVREFVASDCWKDDGGIVGSIQEFNGKLVVVQTPDNQLAVYRLLVMLQRT